MRFVAFLIFLSLVLFAKDEYMSNYEYGKRLYHNPRGIACSECHGEYGNGSILSAYVIDIKGKKVLKEIRVPKINDLNETEFQKPFEDTTSRRYMPTFYLTKEELAHIYYYLHEKAKEFKKMEEKREKKEIKQIKKVEDNVTDENNTK